MFSVQPIMLSVNPIMLSVDPIMLSVESVTNRITRLDTARVIKVEEKDEEKEDI